MPGFVCRPYIIPHTSVSKRI